MTRSARQGCFWLTMVVVGLLAKGCGGESGGELGSLRLPPTVGVAVQAPPAAESDELEEFVPSEEVSADRAVSFPVDI